MTLPPQSIPAPDSGVLAGRRPAAFPAALVTAHGPLTGRGFSLYLILAALLSPLAVPAGPGQTALVDVVNLIGLSAFLFVALLRRVPVELPLALPLSFVAAGSLLAMTNALSLPMALLTLVGDLYLYVWFVAAVALLERRGDFVGVRRAWIVAAVGVACTVLVQAAQGGGFASGMFAAKGFRPGGTFYGPNMCADYLVLSAFLTLGLARRLRLRWRLPALVLMGLAIIATRSNGGLISLLCGLGVWAVVRTWSVGVPRPAIAGSVGLAMATGLVLLWAIVGWGAGGATIHRIATESFFGRVTHSSESRVGIWRHLEETLGKSPLGIGPGNSSARTMRIGEDERPDHNLQSKEAHSDYLGYLVERGPLGFIGLVLATVMVFRRVIRGRRCMDPALFAALLGALVASTVHATVIERLHFRHVWMFLAIVWALSPPAMEPPAGPGNARARRALAPREAVPVGSGA